MRIVLYTDKAAVSLHSAVSRRIVPVIRKHRRKTFSSAGDRDSISGGEHGEESGGVGVGVCVCVCLYTVSMMGIIGEW